jgi:class 3 adenylate cyclase
VEKMSVSPAATRTVTFVFTDIEGSTQLWEHYPEPVQAALVRHDALLRAAIEDNQGHVIKTTGDGLHAVFDSASDGTAAVVAGQRALRAEAWGATGPLQVRMALHTGEAESRAGDYYGPIVKWGGAFDVGRLRRTDIAVGGHSRIGASPPGGRVGAARPGRAPP